MEIKVGWMTALGIGEQLTLVPEIVQLAVIDYRAMDHLKDVTFR